MNIGRYVEMYSKDLQLKNYAESTIQNYCCQVEMFLKHFEGVANKPSEINERHLVEAGTDINLIQRLMGHRSPKTTSIYLHISDSLISRINSPLSAIRV